MLRRENNDILNFSLKFIDLGQRRGIERLTMRIACVYTEEVYGGIDQRPLGSIKGIIEAVDSMEIKCTGTCYDDLEFVCVAANAQRYH